MGGKSNFTRRDGAAKRFLVWRSYGELVDILARVPTHSEIAAHAGLSRSYVTTIMATLHLEGRGQAGAANLRSYEEDDEPMDVFEFIQRNGGE